MEKPPHESGNKKEWNDNYKSIEATSRLPHTDSSLKQR